MRGEILSFDETTGTGLISGDDGQRYGFSRSSLAQPGSVRAGQRVDFVGSGSEASEVMILGGVGGTPGVAGSGGDGIDWKNLFISFNGRIRRSHFWIAWLILLVGGFILGLIPILGTILGLVLIWPNLAIQVKRLHDMGHTGWLVAIPWVANIIGFGVMISTVGLTAFMNMSALENEDPAAVMAIVGPVLGIFGLLFLVNVAFLLWIGLMEGQKGDNKYGPNPKGE